MPIALLPDEDSVSIHLRMPLDLRSKVDAVARQHRRDRNAEILVALDVYLILVEDLALVIEASGVYDFDDTVFAHLRIPTPLLIRLDAIARRNGRSRTGEMLVVLYVYLMVVEEIDACVFDKVIEIAVSDRMVDVVREAQARAVGRHCPGRSTTESAE
jgi:predicted DNA-binding protein